METQRVENGAYGAFCRRIVRGLARRCAAGDLEDLTLIRELRQALDDAEHAAVTGLREQGYSWEQIGLSIGTTKQAVSQRHKRRSAAERLWLAMQAPEA